MQQFRTSLGTSILLRYMYYVIVREEINTSNIPFDTKEGGGWQNRKRHHIILTKRKKKEIWLSPITKPLYQQKIQKVVDNTNRHQKLPLHNDYGPTMDGQFEWQKSFNWCA